MTEAGLQPDHDKGSARRLLYISAGQVPVASGRDQVTTLAFEALTLERLQAIAPDLVVFPLVSATQDAAVIIAKLQELGYRGQCLVLCPKLPKPGLIEAELRALGPGLEVQVLASDAPVQQRH